MWTLELSESVIFRANMGCVHNHAYNRYDEYVVQRPFAREILGFSKATPSYTKGCPFYHLNGCVPSAGRNVKQTSTCEITASIQNGQYPLKAESTIQSLWYTISFSYFVVVGATLEHNIDRVNKALGFVRERGYADHLVIRFCATEQWNTYRYYRMNGECSEVQ
jgi:hypothetical protein